jgi:hypothetical protein
MQQSRVQRYAHACSEDYMQTKKRILLVCFSLVVVIFLAYTPLFHSGFINYDDDIYITNNSHLLHGITIEGIRWAFTSGYAGNWHPLTWLSHMLDVQLSYFILQTRCCSFSFFSK